jgi:hypothetical protein
MSWMRHHVQGPKEASYAARVLERYRLGIKAGGALQGVRVVASEDSCRACSALAGITYDPDAAPIIPVVECTSPGGCRCAYAAVMAYDLAGLKPDHRPKGPDYGQRLLARYRLGIRAGGAIGGIRVVAAPDSCAACRALAGPVYAADQAPLIPVADCTTPQGCRCAYATVMAYDVPGAAQAHADGS